MNPTHPAEAPPETDPIEALAHQVPLVLPLMGAVLIFLLACIAVNLA